MRKVTPQRPGEQIAKTCTRCHERVWIVLFRLLSSNVRASMCEDCERAYDTERYRGRKAPIILLDPHDHDAFDSAKPAFPPGPGGTMNEPLSLKSVEELLARRKARALRRSGD